MFTAQLVALLNREGITRLILLALLSGFALVVGLYSFSSHQSVQLYRASTYWVYWVLVLLWGRSCYEVFRGVPKATWQIGRREAVALSVVVLVTIWMGWGLQEGGLRIVNDDTLQVQTSRQLFRDHDAGILSRGHVISGKFVDLDLTVDKRPALFPWFVAQLHSIRGYDFDNAVTVSRASLVALGVLLFVIGRAMGGVLAGVLLPLLVMATPLLVHHANGAGFEVFNLAAIALLWVTALIAARFPSHDSIALLLLSAVVAANVRYESVVFILPAAVCAALVWMRAGRILLDWKSHLAPLLMIPWFWRHKMFAADSTWQLESKPEAGSAAFSIRYIYENVGRTLNFFLSNDVKDANSALIFVLGVFAAAFWLLALYKRRSLLRGAPLTGLMHYVMWGGLWLHFGLMMCYFWGHFDDLTTQRLAIPELLWLSVPIVGVIAHLDVPRKVWGVGISAVGIYLLTFTAPTLARNDLLASNTAAYTQERLRRWISKNHLKNRLAIDRFAGRVWLLSDTPVVTPTMLFNKREGFQYHWDAGSFSEVLCVQGKIYDKDAATWVTMAEDDLGPDFVLEEVFSFPTNPHVRFTVCRVIKVGKAHPDWRPPPDNGDLLNRRTKWDIEWVNSLP